MADERVMVGDGGNHVCYIADAAAVSTDFLNAFARRGAARRQQVAWLVDERRDGALARIAGQHARGGDGVAADGPVVVRSADELYLDGGRFDADRMLDRYRSQVSAALDAGYTGLRVIADTSWLCERPELFAEMVEYEHRISQLFADGSFAAVCHYDPAAVPARWLTALAAAHPLHLDPPSESLATGAFRVGLTPAGVLEIVGEVDFSGAEALAAVLADFAPIGDDIHVDLSRLEFIDVAGTRALVEVATRLHNGHRLILHGGPRALRLVLEASAWANLPQLALDDLGG